MTLSPNNLTFEALNEAYKAALKTQLGRALRLHEGAVFLERGEIYAVRLSEEGVVQMGTAGCISPEAWDEERCCWDCDDCAETTVAAVNTPTFIDIPDKLNPFL
ncbi:hypothetical protein [Pseudomonas viridiflava]|uniref:hypothetical protein n=1 Tax=Pseudomonas viridiflava TaxID=33069 RepID=UPI000F04BD04|nr:hypothetical protein [Pseudomonas viridiflava]